MNEQQSDDYCQSMLQLMMERETEYSVDDRGLIVRLDPKTGRTQICIPKSLRERIMTLGHYPQIAGHPGGTRMYHPYHPHCRRYHTIFVGIKVAAPHREMQGQWQQHFADFVAFLVSW
jgi:hypothetical protein